MTDRHAASDPVWGQDHAIGLVARNVGTRYLALAVDGVIGLWLLPFNLHHLGQSSWGLWMLMWSLTSYLSILDLGYGGSITRFVAHYRARRDPAGLNEILSTMIVVFSAIGEIGRAHV